MRTKVLVGLAALAAGAFTATAQNVYSLNVVGYINLPLVPGFNLVANQLDADGTGTNNTVAGVIGTNIPAGTIVYTWDPSVANYNLALYGVIKGVTKWDAGGANAFNPGQGAWVSIPAGSANTTVTTVGQVMQGSLVNNQIPALGGFALLGNVVPVSGLLQHDLNYSPKIGDLVYKWDPAIQNYDLRVYGIIKGVEKWDNEPTINVGEGFWLTTTNHNSTWSTNFTVQ
jgi:hypothetical protein